MLRPRVLKSGDTIGIAATARKISRIEVEIAQRVFESWGLKVQYSPTLFSEQNQYAGSDQERAEGLQALINDPNVKAIVLARGGYGTVRMVDRLSITPLLQQPKWLIGFSDATVLHGHLNKHANLQTIHGPMVLNMQPDRWDEESMLSLRNALFSEEAIHIQSEPHALNRIGEAKGKLTGGNLSVLYSLTGSASQPDTNGCILFLEDLDEYLYHIDRMMVNLKRTGMLTHLAALVVGQMSDMKDNTIPFGKSAEAIIAEHVAEFSYPVCFGFPSGHEKRNLSLRFGADTSLQVQPDCVRLVNS